MDTTRQALKLQVERDDLEKRMQLVGRIIQNYQEAGKPIYFLLPTKPDQTTHVIKIEPHMIAIPMTQIVDGYLANLKKQIELKSKEIFELLTNDDER